MNHYGVLYTQDWNIGIADNTIKNFSYNITSFKIIFIYAMYHTEGGKHLFNSYALDSNNILGDKILYVFLDSAYSYRRILLENNRITFRQGYIVDTISNTKTADNSACVVVRITGYF